MELPGDATSLQAGVPVLGSGLNVVHVLPAPHGPPLRSPATVATVDVGDPTAFLPPRAHQCLVCDRVFRRRQDYTDHMRIHEDVKPFACELCGKEFRTKRELGSHARTHEAPHINCPYCALSCTNKSNMNKHVRRMHLKQCRCTVEGCDVVVEDQVRLLLHQMQIHHLRPPPTCPRCAARIADDAQMKLHLTLHFAARQFQCPVCHDEFGTRTSYYRHYRLKHPDDEGTVIGAGELDTEGLDDPTRYHPGVYS